MQSWEFVAFLEINFGNVLPFSQQLLAFTRGDWKVLSLPYLTKRCENQILSVKYITYLYLFWIVNSFEALFIIFSHAVRVDMFWVSRKTVKFEHRKAIKYLQLKGMTLSQILETLQGTSGEDALLYATEKCWVSQLKRGNESVEVEPRPRRPSTAATSENNDLVLEMVMKYRRLSARQRAARLGISQERVGNIRTKSSVWGWCQHNGSLTFEPKTEAQSLTMCAGNLELFGVDQDNFWALFVTTGNTWPNTTSWIQRNSRHKLKTHSHPPRERKDSLGFLLGFLAFSRILLVDYFQKDRIINVQCKANQLNHLQDNIKQKRPRILIKEVLFHQGNVPAHMLVVMMATIRDCGLQFVSHLPNSPGLAPSDFK